MIKHIPIVCLMVAMSTWAVAATATHENRQGSNKQSMVADGQQTFPFGHPGKRSAIDRVIKITATEFKFTPSEIRVKSGETIRFDVTNIGKTNHEFVLGTSKEQLQHDKEMAERPNMKMDDDPNGISVPVGGTASLVWTFTKPMTIQYACHVPGHYAAGMYGKLVID